MPMQATGRPIGIVIIIRDRIATWVEGRHEAWVALIFLSVFAAFIELGYAGSAKPHSVSGFFAALTYTLSIALAALIVGIFLGFLFGIPRTLSGNNPSSKESDGFERDASSSTERLTAFGVGPDRHGPDRQVNFGVNTNLEQISDWLTKMLVGVGLTQISKLPVAIRVLSSALKPGFGDTAGAGAIGVLIVIFFSVCGFLIGYLWTRIYLRKEFASAESEATARLAAKVSTMESKSEQVAAALSTVQAQPDKDAIALNLMQKVLEPASGDTPPTQDVLDRALFEGSPALKVQVFYTARKERKDARDTSREQKVAAMVIPIFRALKACDSTNRYHRTRAQLAYALYEQNLSDVQGALAEIESAMKIRDKKGANGYWKYEVFRAICHIRQLENVPSEQQSLLKDQILDDLRFAASKDLDSVKEVSKAVDWLKEQGIRVEDLARNT
ncbi:hypothetical protein [Granulicella arctica]|uniref:hypothetical protein n=1 Tax=Granulicella arctica TaxID=940613 RepID=UPI0021DF5D5C|nr:hypothetical protein [Granulicella arctica]